MAGPDPAVAALRWAVRQDLADLPNQALVLVACSGGPDSLALAAATAFEAPRLELRAGAVCLDHSLLPGSAAVTQAAQTSCSNLGLSPVIGSSLGLSQGSNLEARARQARYAALEVAAKQTGAKAILLGHTLDDQAETVLLALGRGAGQTALAGMAPRRGLLRRPLLAITRSQTVQACQAQGLVPWLDPTNQADGPLYSARAQVRHKVLPELEKALGGGVAAALARTAQQVSNDLAFLDQAAAALLTEVSQVANPNRLDAQALARAHPALRHRALKLFAHRLGADPASLTAAHIKALDSLVSDWHGQGPASLPGGLQVGRECGKLEALPRKNKE